MGSNKSLILLLIAFFGCGTLTVIFFFAGAVSVGAYVLNNPEPTPAPNASSSGSGSAAGVTVPGTVARLTVKGHEILMPATKGKVGSEGATSGLAFSCNAQEIKWYMNMRWPYDYWAWSGLAKPYDNTSTLYARKKVIIYNPKTKKSVVSIICEAGPAPWTGSSWQKKLPSGIRGSVAAIFSYAKSNPPSYWTGYKRFDPTEFDGRVAGITPAAANAIGAHEDDILEYGFAQDQSLPLGPVK